MTFSKGFYLSLAVTALAAITLFVMGRELICTCGYVKLWHGVVFSSENSQHLSDWYTPSHIIHGLVFYAITSFVLSRSAIGWRLAAATVVECAWEILENTDRVIQHYREVTISLDYFGDSVINSVADVGAMMFGFWLASRLPVWASIGLAVVFETLTLWIIRDGLILNVVMLVWPLEAIKTWQSAL